MEKVQDYDAGESVTVGTRKGAIRESPGIRWWFCPGGVGTAGWSRGSWSVLNTWTYTELGSFCFRSLKTTEIYYHPTVLGVSEFQNQCNWVKIKVLQNWRLLPLPASKAAVFPWLAATSLQSRRPWSHDLLSVFKSPTAFLLEGCMYMRLQWGHLESPGCLSISNHSI